MKTYLLILTALAAFSLRASERPNVLFIAVDDLNDWIGVLDGHPQAITPNIDQLAKEGTLFSNAHCQAPICGPSRASILTGLAPATSGIYLQINDEQIKRAGPEAAASVFLPDWFELFGYRTIGSGKIFHKGDGAGVFDVFLGGPRDFGPRPEKRVQWDPEAMGLNGSTSTDWAPFPERDDQMPDYKVANYISEELKKTHKGPFFMAAGFVRPHVPWYVPQKWFDMYPLETIQTPPYLADDMDDVSERGQRINEMLHMPTTEWALENDKWKEIVQAYLACVTFVDAQIGKVLNALEESRYADNTVVVLWSDHGYHLGEKNRFAKQAIWERSTRVPLIVKAPDFKGEQLCDAPVQLLDLYPTLLDLCGLPENPANDGRSLAPLLRDPELRWDHLAVTSYGVDNWSLRSRGYRYIVYDDGSEELYDMEKDPNEWYNLAENRELKNVLKRFRNAVPETQAPMSDQCSYDVNDYWRNVVGKRKKTSGR